MKHKFLFPLLALALTACQEDDTSWKGEIEGLRTEITNQNKIIDFLKQNVYVKNIESKNDQIQIMLSNNLLVGLDNKFSVLASANEEGFWCINGNATTCKADGNAPDLKVSDSGYWMINGTETDVKAETANKGLYIESVVKTNDLVTFNLSDGSSISCLASCPATPGAGDWQELTANPLDRISREPGFTSIFKTWGFIGDSYTSGEFEYQDSTGKFTSSAFYDYSWGQCLCRMTGSTGTNFSRGGTWTTAWLTEDESSRGWEMAKKDPKQAYIIAMGYNDIYTWGNTPKGDLATDVHLDDYTKNPATYAGNIAGMIQRLKELNPNAYFFLVTLPNEPPLTQQKPTDEYNDVLRGMPALFTHTYVIDLYRHAPVYDAEFKEKYFLGMHMSPVGYQHTAYMFATYIDWIIRKNPADFTDVFKQGERWY